MLYFDHNATSPLSLVAKEAWLRAVEQYPGNPSSPHRLGSRSDVALEGAREKLAGWLGCNPGEIVWTSGATEAVNMAFHHLALRYQGEAWVSAIEHPCVLSAVVRHFPGRHRLIPVDRDGVVDMDWLDRALSGNSPEPSVIAVMAANNETGVLQPWQDVRDLCQNAGIEFFCDAAQWIGKMPAAGLGQCAFLTGCAHKFGGPQGVGFLKCPHDTAPLIVGGPQEDGRRAGTENVAGVLSMIAELQEREAAMDGLAEREALRMGFESELVRQVPGLTILGFGRPRLWNTVFVVMPEIDCRQRWVVRLDAKGAAVSTGSACASGKEKPSHVLTAMGVPPDVAGRVLRFSSGWNTTPADWDRLLGLVLEAAGA